MGQLTPMLRQYIGIKGEHPDSILFFRMGDFYEMFFDDAKIASRILGITLTARGTYDGKKVPMCGVPHHASKAYIAKLVSSGHKVAICEQIEDPKSSKGIVKREVTRVVTPGSIVDEGDVDDKSNLYIAAICSDSHQFGLAYSDLSTGDFYLTEIGSWGELLDELARIDAAEVLVPKDKIYLEQMGLSRYRLEKVENDIFDRHRAENILKDQLNVNSLESFGCQNMKEGVAAAAALIRYLSENQKGTPQHIKKIECYHAGNFMFLDESTFAHLELLKTMRRQSSKGSLFDVLDKAVTSMGSRLLKKWISYPLIEIESIRKRLAAVSWFKDDAIQREEIVEELKGIYDLERLNGRVSLGRANARDLIALRLSIIRLPIIKNKLSKSNSILLSEIAGSIDCLKDIAELIGEAIHEDPPVSIKEGGIIKEGYSEELDVLITLSRNGKSWIKEFAATEQNRTGISSLKVGFNKVFGYYIEISKANLHLAPPDYIRKQTLVNGERYITESLKLKEEQVLSSEEKRLDLEFRIFNIISGMIAAENQRIKKTAALIAQLDVIAGLASVAELNDYTCPEINDSHEINIVDGRHPVIEKTFKEEDFVPNDVYMDSEEQQLLIITGPNMAGKSTILRQTALTVLMSQMGSFVPASRAVIGLVDRIFTRVGASDDLARGQSTFMVEMNETANILRNASPMSLVILDEVGRGTSTYDGLSIAWAVAEALHDLDGSGVRTLFATHYHELTELANTKSRVKNFNIAVKEWDDRIIFLRKIVPGSTSRSYGIQVARIAGIPEEVINRAKEILENLESPDLMRTLPGISEENGIQLDLFGHQNKKIRERIKKINVSSMTPLEALVELNGLKEFVDSGK
ncbi:DNA mismatch repair protein MutS [Thermodesulfobacteriota bacterium]